MQTEKRLQGVFVFVKGTRTHVLFYFCCKTGRHHLKPTGRVTSQYFVSDTDFDLLSNQLIATAGVSFCSRKYNSRRHIRKTSIMLIFHYATQYWIKISYYLQLQKAHFALATALQMIFKKLITIFHFIHLFIQCNQNLHFGH